MIYHRSEEDAKKLLKGRMRRFSALRERSERKEDVDLSELVDFVMEAYGNMRQLGLFGQIQKSNVWVHRILDRKVMKFKATRGILNDMISNGIFEDATKEDCDYVVLYGRFEKGVVVEATALNLTHVPGLYSSFRPSPIPRLD